MSCGYDALNWWYTLEQLESFNAFVVAQTQEVWIHKHFYSNTELFAYCEAKKLNVAFIHGSSDGMTWFCNGNVK